MNLFFSGTKFHGAYYIKPILYICRASNCKGKSLKNGTLASQNFETQQILKAAKF